MARKTASADSPPPPISPSPTRPLSVSTSTMVRTKRPQWQPLAWRNGASSGTVTVVARISRIFIFCFMVQQCSATATTANNEREVMLKEQWETFKRAARREKMDKIPMALIVDSPWIPGYLGIKHMDYFLDPGTLVRIQPQDHARVSRYHLHPLVVDGVRDGGGTLGAGRQDQVLAGQHAERIPHAVSPGRHRQFSGV